MLQLALDCGNFMPIRLYCLHKLHICIYVYISCEIVDLYDC